MNFELMNYFRFTKLYCNVLACSFNQVEVVVVLFCLLTFIGGGGGGACSG